MYIFCVMSAVPARCSRLRFGCIQTPFDKNVTVEARQASYTLANRQCTESLTWGTHFVLSAEC